ncbi:class Ib ribonucleoside-diphosphate reductase assembly flavoprotein NrdI [Liquorilactobacillus mali]|uniref:Ribonucleotide reductase n=1 Tax=Liquorilactobacillus mali TaxID=1618 RepID=A0A0R2FWQ9_9LACO|nr:class Ib ribonucleoside-diphosphate reductase assembly flavoprotein NrdI [Liquorilactobacillus mali]KRN32091.1 ribonucleotide reductase [Liquorilactobacillus mali]
MNKQINILYISLSGNTKAFIGKLTQYFAEQGVTVNALNVKEFPEFTRLNAPFVTFLPTFLKGGNGIDSGYTEILTTILGDYLAYENNYRYCYGIIGSGNRNFNKQFALTAKQYASRFGFPVLAEFELRGTKSDVSRIAQKITVQQAVFEKQK